MREQYEKIYAGILGGVRRTEVSNFFPLFFPQFDSQDTIKVGNSEIDKDKIIEACVKILADLVRKPVTDKEVIDFSRYLGQRVPAEVGALFGPTADARELALREKFFISVQDMLNEFSRVRMGLKPSSI